MDTLFSPIILVLVIIFFSSLVRTTFGFGDALIAMPLLALVIDIKIASPIVAAIALVIAIYIISGNFRSISYRNLWVLIIFSLIGVPIGVLFLTNANEYLVKISLGVVLILFGFFRIFKPNLLYLKTNAFAPVFAIIAGILGGAYNTNGPPIIIYGNLKRWEPDTFRATLQGIFLPINITIVISHILGGLWNSEVVILSLYTIPAVLLGIALGTYLNKKIEAEKFINYVNILLILLGFLMILK